MELRAGSPLALSMKPLAALVLFAAVAMLSGCAGTRGGPDSGGGGYRSGSGVEMFGTIDTSVRRVETK